MPRKWGAPSIGTVPGTAAHRGLAGRQRRPGVTFSQGPDHGVSPAASPAAIRCAFFSSGG
jgi:hypothetical protein